MIDIGCIYMTENFLTVAELAARWALSDQSIRRKITAGAIPALRAPGSRTLRISSEFVQNHERAFSRATTTTTTTTVSTAI